MVFYRRDQRHVGLERSGPPKLQLIEAGTSTGKMAGHLASAIYDSFRSYKDDRCAIFMHHDETGSFLAGSGIDAEHLSPGTNIHWQGGANGFEEEVETHYHRRLSRLVLLVHEVAALQRVPHRGPLPPHQPGRPPGESRGYLDGLLTRLLNKPHLHRVIVIEEASLWPVVEQWMGSNTSIWIGSG